MEKLPTIILTVLVCMRFAEGFDKSLINWKVKDKIIEYGEDLILRCTCGDTNSTVKYKSWIGGPNYTRISLDEETLNKTKYDIIIRQKYYILVIKNVGESDINELYKCVCGFHTYSKTLLISDVFTANWSVEEKIIGYGEDLTLRCTCVGDTNSTLRQKSWTGGPNFKLLSLGIATLDQTKYDITIRRQYYILIIKNVGKSDINELYRCQCVLGDFTKRLLMDDVFKANWKVEEKIIGYGEDVGLRCTCVGNTNSTLRQKSWTGGPNSKLLSVGIATLDQSKYDIIIRIHYYELTIKNVGKSDINELYQCACGFSNFTKLLLMDDVFEEPTPPKHFKAIALENKIILKWTAENRLRFQLTFGVEYREYFEPFWKRMSAENKSTAIIDRLRHGTLYFVRVFSMTAIYESNRTEEIVVKTEKQHSMVHVISVKFAVIVGALPLTMFLCWWGTKGWTNRRSCCKIQYRVTPSRIPDDLSVRQDHYEEIGSMYYNPHMTVTDQDTTTSPHIEILQAPIYNGNNQEIFESNNHNSQNMIPCDSHLFESNQKNSSPRSSSDESYLIPSNSYIDFELENVTINEHQEIRIETNELQVLDKSSFSSNDSETVPKSIRKYETLKLPDAHECSYERYKETDL